MNYLWITNIHFWTHKDMEGLPGWVISSMPGPPPTQHEHERQYIPSTHTSILKWRIWKDDYDGQMIFGEPCGPKASWHLSYRWEKLRKNLTQETWSDRVSNPCPLHDRRACYRLLHSGGRYTLFNIKKKKKTLKLDYIVPGHLLESILIHLIWQMFSMTHIYVTNWKAVRINY